MQHWLRSLLIFAIVSATAVVSFGRDKDTPPKIVEYRDVPMQTVQFQDQKTPRDCTGGGFLSLSEVCWQVYPIAWQTFNGEKKGINLLINVWGTESSGVDFTNAALAISIDGNVINLPEMDWNPGRNRFDGNTAIVKSESLIRMLAAGSEVWLTAHAVPRISVKLPTKTLKSMQAVIAKYDTLVTVGSSAPSFSENGTQLQQVDAKLLPLAREYRGLMDRSKECPATISRQTCLETIRDFILTGQKVVESVIPLLRERISILKSGTLDGNTQKEQVDTLRWLDKMRADSATLPALLEQTNQALAQEKLKSATP